MALARSDPADRERTPGSPREHAPGEGAHAMVRLLAREGIWHRDGRHAGAGGAVAKLARSTRRSALCGPRWLARREREEAPQERTGAIRESSGSAGHDPISVAISPVPEGQRLGTVVPSPHRERPRHSQDHDCGLGAGVVEHLAACSHDLVNNFGHVNRHTDGTRLIGERTVDRLSNPPDGVG